MNQSDTPPPTNPGGSGTQERGSSNLQELLANSSLAGIVLAVKTLAEENPKAMGGNVAATLMLGLVTTLGCEATASRDEATGKTDKIEKMKDDLSEERQKTARLAERISGMTRMQTATQYCMTMASILVGVAVDGYKSNNTPIFMIAGGIAIALLAGSWVWPRLKGRNDV